jgi:hypothetical protein
VMDRDLSLSIQPAWCRSLSLQQQSVLLLAGRGPDGIDKMHPAKRVHVAYRGCVFLAAKYGRELLWGERADGFMSLNIFADDDLWSDAVEHFLSHIDSLPHHYLMHLMHGVQILGFKHPDFRFRARWMDFYMRMVEDMHLEPESEEQMDKRLSDWGREHW